MTTYQPTLTLYDTDDGALATSASLTPTEAARHARNLTHHELALLSSEARLAVARVRPIRMWSGAGVRVSGEH